MGAGDLNQVAAAQMAVDVADRQIRAAVATAREAGYVWPEIGAALGVSRQLAHQRFGVGHQALWRAKAQTPVRPVELPPPSSPGVPLLEQITAAQDGVVNAAAGLTAAVVAARDAGEIWRDIGAQLGISPQAAYERWGRR